MFREKALAVSFAIIASVAPLSATGIVGTLPPKDANLIVPLQEAPANALALLGMFVGDDPLNPLPWTGTVTDTGWTYSLSAPYRDGSLTMKYTGSLDLAQDLASWAGTGSFVNPFGSYSWTSNGTYTQASVDGDFLDFVGIVVIAGLTITGDLVVAGAQGITTVASVGALGAPAIAASGTAVGVITGAGVTGIVQILKNNDGKVQSHVQQSPAKAPFVPPHPIIVPRLIRPPDYPGIDVTSTSQITGNYADATVFISGTSTITDVPEPGTGRIALTGLLTLAASGWLRRCRRFARPRTDRQSPKTGSPMPYYR